MNMRDAVKQYNFIRMDMVSIKYSSWFKGAEDGSPNGSNGLRSMGLKVLKTGAVLQNESVGSVLGGSEVSGLEFS